MSENEEIFNSLINEIEAISDCGASGVFRDGYDENDYIRATKTVSPTGHIRIFLWPDDGGVLILNPDGTWDGDIAPGHG